MKAERRLRQGVCRDGTRGGRNLTEALNDARREVLEKVAGMAEKQSKGMSRNPRLALEGHARAVRKLAEELGEGN
jgi:hypothetical protein